MKKYFLINIVLMVLIGCSVGPDYTRPTVTVPSDFKELKGWRKRSPAIRKSGQSGGKYSMIPYSIR